MTVLIDTLGARNRLINEYGVEKKTAEGIVTILSDLDEQVATKADMEILRRDVRLTVYTAAGVIVLLNGLLEYLLR